MDHNIISKGIRESDESKWDTSLGLDVLSLAFINRSFSDEINDNCEICTEDYSTISSLGSELMISLVQDEPIHIYTHPHTRHFVGEACFGGRFGKNTRELESAAITLFLNLILAHFLALKKPKENEKL